MYGTLSFNKSNKRSSPEFNAFSSIHGRRQRQPACDECRIARVKCREKPGKDKCGRCHGTSRPCTYNSSRRRRQSGRPAGFTESSTSPVKIRNDAQEDDAYDPETPSVAGQDISTPAQEHSSPKWRDITQDCHFDSFGHFGDLIADAPGSADIASPKFLSEHPAHADMNGRSGSVNNHEAALDMLSLNSVTTAIENNEPNNYEFRALFDGSFPQLFQLPPSPSPTPSLICNSASRNSQHQQLSNLSLDTPSTHLLSPHEASTQDNTAPRSLAGLADLAELMQFTHAGGVPSATPVANSCTCLQDLTFNLFALRSRGGDMPVDRFLLLFKEAMRKLKAVDTCPSECCVSQSPALLMLMNVQQIVSLLLEASSGLRASHKPESILTINIGSFAVEDGTDQRLISQMILASRIKELSSFITGVYSKSKIAGLNDVHVEYQHQLDLLRRSFTS